MEEKNYSNKPEKLLKKLSQPGKKLSSEEVKEAVNLLNDYGDKFINDIYNHLFNSENLRTKIDLYADKRDDTEELNNVRDEINKILGKLSSLDYFERNFDVNIKEAMIEHYLYHSLYPYDMLTLMHLVMIDAIKYWYYDNLAERNDLSDSLESLKNIEKSIRIYGVDDIKSTSLATTTILMMSYQENELESSIKINEKSSEFIKTPSKFIDEPIGSVKLDNFVKDNRLMHEIVEKLYAEMKEHGYFSDLFPTYEEFTQKFQGFEDGVIESIINLPAFAPNAKFSTVMMVTYYTNVLNYLANKAASANNPLIKSALEIESEKIKSIINSTIDRNAISMEEIGEAETLLKFIKNLKEDKLQGKKNSFEEGYL